MKLQEFFTKENPRNVWTLKEDAPEWLRDAIYEAHQGAMPNDWIYQECRAVCDAIGEGSLTDEDSVHQYADGRVDVYTQHLAQWYADHCLGSMYAQAEEDAEDSLSGSVNDQLTVIQYSAIARIASTILQAWEAQKAEGES